MNIYIHIPFCKRKCLYCDFYSVGHKLADWPRFTTALINEFNQKISKPNISSLITNTYSIYLGGGTPSLIPTEELQTISSHIIDRLGSPLEFTIEINPDDVIPDMVNAWKNAGINRISMGVQSLVDEELTLMGRRHDAFTAIKAFDVLNKDFSNISLDIMFGLPNQSINSLDYTIQCFLEMHPAHISAYSLMYEERTALTRLRDDGKIKELDDISTIDMFNLISHRLKEAGYIHYEISNYALPGFKSHHNSDYWNGTPYLGIGPGAHSYDGNRIRSYNKPDIDTYISKGPVVSQELLTDTELAEEMIMTRLRTNEGVNMDEYRMKFGTSEYKRLMKSAEIEIAAGRLHISNENHLKLTPESIMISDQIISSLF